MTSVAAAPGWLSARTVHLPGGSRAFNGFDPSVYLYPTVVKGQRVAFQARAYGSLYADLAARDVAPIGFEFLSRREEAEGTMPIDWRTYLPWDQRSVWPCDDQIVAWSHISFAAGDKKEAQLWDLARRISHQLRVCSWRLYQLSESYHAQLHARVAEGDFKAGGRFADGFTWLGYLAAQAYLVDACVLRDYLAEFYAAYGPSKGASTRVSSMSGLKRHVLSKSATGDSLFLELKAAIASGGWLHVLGAYRDLVVHCTPLARAESPLWALAIELPIKNGPLLPGVSLPLPADPSSVAAARSAPDRLKRLTADLELLTDASLGSGPRTDALVYCYTCLDQLTRLASSLSRLSPTAARMPKFVRQPDGTMELQ